MAQNTQESIGAALAACLKVAEDLDLQLKINPASGVGYVIILTRNDELYEAAYATAEGLAVGLRRAGNRALAKQRKEGEQADAAEVQA